MRPYVHSTQYIGTRQWYLWRTRRNTVCTYLLQCCNCALCSASCIQLNWNNVPSSRKCIAGIIPNRNIIQSVYAAAGPICNELYVYMQTMQCLLIGLTCADWLAGNTCEFAFEWRQIVVTRVSDNFYIFYISFFAAAQCGTFQRRRSSWTYCSVFQCWGLGRWVSTSICDRDFWLLYSIAEVPMPKSSMIGFNAQYIYRLTS